MQREATIPVQELMEEGERGYNSGSGGSFHPDGEPDGEPATVAPPLT